MKTRALPQPDVIAQAHSDRVLSHIRSVIAEQGGRIAFADYMQLALYAPGLGYYSAGAEKLGKAGDFVTAPEISPLFGQCLARRCAAVLSQMPGGGDIVEFGAGSGQLAVDLLRTLAEQDHLPAHYYILEVSADLKQRQQRYIQSAIPEIAGRVIWLDRLPASPIQGVILANEVLDAMPVHLFRTAALKAHEAHRVEEAFVAWDTQQQQLVLTYEPTRNAQLKTRVQALSLPPDYTSEINLQLPDWIKSLHDLMANGIVILIDYGFLAPTYYCQDRTMGTLMCHYRHHAHDNPLIFPGLQDITAHVDFTVVGESAEAAGFTVESFSTQADFLMSHGLLEYAQSAHHNAHHNTPHDARTIAKQSNIAHQIKQLTLPSEMGEIFKVMVLCV